MRIVPPLAEVDPIQLGLMISTSRLFQIKGYKVSADKFGLGLRDRVFLAVVQRQQHLRRATPPLGEEIYRRLRKTGIISWLNNSDQLHFKPCVRPLKPEIADFSLSKAWLEFCRRNHTRLCGL